MEKLKMKPMLTLDLAKSILRAAEEEADKNQWNVAIAVTDDTGELISFIRKDDTTHAAIEIAQKKAYHAANYRRDTIFHESILAEGNENMAVLSLPNVMPVEGGMQLVYNGYVVGAIGVSGSASYNDGQVAKKGCEMFLKLIEE